MITCYIFHVYVVILPFFTCMLSISKTDLRIFVLGYNKSIIILIHFVDLFVNIRIHVHVDECSLRCMLFYYIVSSLLLNNDIVLRYVLSHLQKENEVQKYITCLSLLIYSSF